MKISVIIPTYNRLVLLQRAVESVRKQSLRPAEIIVVDNSSDDGTQAWLEQQSDIVACFHDSNQGVSAGRNSGIKRAQGDWLAFLDSDDEWVANKLERQVACLKADPSLRVCHTGESWIRNGKSIPVSITLINRAGWIYHECLPLCVISPSSVMMHREVFERIGGFDESLPACEDYDLWLRLCALYPVGFIDEALVIKYGGHDDQLSRQYWGMDRFRIQALTKSLRSGLLTAENEVATRAMLAEKIRIYCVGAAKRDKHEEIRHYEDLLTEFSA
jgi:glycosyltransferase involved in cell wall biosynthesis